jgi:hypothetical protein
MRSFLVACAALAPVLASGCSQPVGPEGRVGAVRSPIAYGAADTLHTAVVAVLAPVGTTALQECTGSIVRVTGGDAFVLTAAHCCNLHIPTLVVASSDYAVGEPYLAGGTPAPPVYPVTPGSVYYDALYAEDMQLDHDFCMLQFTGAPANTATLSLPSTSDALAVGSSIEHVGFGFTETSTMNSQRRTGTDTVDQLTALMVEYPQGGTTDVPGTCEGDSGGPALLPAGAPQAQQVVTAVTSYGSSSSCAQTTFGVGSRVSSAMGAGGFIASYLAGAPIGVHAGAPPQAVSASGGGWASALLAAGLVAAGLFEIVGRRMATIRP